jgi:hypothetical protein
VCWCQRWIVGTNFSKQFSRGFSVNQSQTNCGDCMPRSNDSPFDLAQRTGDSHVTIFAGVSCLEVLNAHPGFQAAWNEYEESLVDAAACKMALAACFDLMRLSQSGIQATFYPNGRVVKSERVSA